MAITFAFRWGWVLGIALFMPAALPAGGAELRCQEICRFHGKTSFLAGDSCELLSSPFVFAPSLRSIELGTPLRVLRSWKSINGKEWLQVQISTSAMLEPSSSVRRGWVNV